MPRKTLWLVAAGLVLVLYAVWRGGSRPARVVIFNHSGRAVQELAVVSAGRRVFIGELRNGDSRAVSVPSGARLTLTFRGTEERRWISPKETSATKAVMLSIDGRERVAEVDPTLYR